MFPKLGDLSGKRWSELPTSAKDVLQFASITVSALEDATREDVNELFLRLQRGERLRSVETRNAISGPVRDFVAERLATHPFWPLTGIREARFGYHEHSAILLALVIEGGPTALKSPDLHALYENTKFDPEGVAARECLDLLDGLRNIANHGVGIIKTRWGLVDLALAVMSLSREEKQPSDSDIMEFFEKFERERRNVAVSLSDLQSELVDQSHDEEITDYSIYLPNMSRDMLHYHLAFTREGGTKENVATRASILYRSLTNQLSADT